MKNKTLQAIFFFLVCAHGCMWAQTNIVVFDKQTGELLPNAHFCFESLDKSEIFYGLTDKNGAVANIVKTRSIFTVSYVGYVTITDTIAPGASKKIYIQPSSMGLDEVVVTAQFSPKKVDESIYKVRVINNKVVEQKGATNLADLISNELNFSPVRDAALGTSVRIQGLGGEHVKILIDGVPMIGRQNGILDLSQVNVASIDHIEIVEGPMSVVYGSNAMAGVINIITRENKRQSIEAGAEGYYETVGVYDFDADFSVNKGKNAVGISLGRYFFDGYSEVDTSRAQEWDPKLQYNLEGYYTFRTNNWKAKISSSFFSEELRDVGYLNPDLDYEGAFDYYHFTKRLDTRLETVRNFKGSQNINVSAAYSFYKKSKISYLNDLVNLQKYIIPEPDASDTTTFNNIFSRGTYSNENKKWLTYQAGYELTMETATGKRLEKTENIGDIAGFLSAKILPFNNFYFQPGLRYIYNFNYKAPLIFSLNFKWDIYGIFGIRGSYATGFRAPSIKELYLNFQDINHNIQGNPNLEAETGNNFNLWFDYKLDKGNHFFLLENNFYYNKINNKIELLFDPDDPTAAIYFNVPAAAVISKGFSTSFTYKMHPRFTINAGVFHNRLSSIVDTDQFTNSTDFTTSLQYNNIKYGFEILLFYKFTDRYSRYTGSIDQETGEIYDVTLSYLDSYHNMDIILSIPFPGNSFRMSTGVKNIFDNKSIPSSGAGGVHSGGSDGSSLLNWGRTYFLRFSYNFSKFFK